MKTYNTTEIFQAINRQIAKEIQMGANDKQAELATSILRGFMAELEREDLKA
jgi:hypothetical protein